MLFRNLYMFRFPLGTIESAEALSSALRECDLQPCAAVSLASHGFVRPIGDDGDFVVDHNGVAAFALGTEARLLPSDVVRRETAKRIEKAEELHGHRLTSGARKQIKDEVFAALVPQSFVRFSRTDAFVDLNTGWLVVDTGSRQRAELVCQWLRNALGKFPCTPLTCEQSPRAIFTDWLICGKTPDGITLGDSAVLREPVEHGSALRCTHQDLETEEVREHLLSGKQVYELALSFNDRVSFTIDESLTIKKFRLLDIVQDELDKELNNEVEASVAAHRDIATFLIMAAEVKKIHAWLTEMFGVTDQPTLKLDGGDAAPEMKEPDSDGPIRNAKTDAGARKAKEAFEKAGLSVSVGFRVGNDLTEQLNNLKRLKRSHKKWLTDGERGASSEVIFARMHGIDVGENPAYPLDPSDLRRCLLLLEAIPDFDDRLSIAVSEVSPVWGRFVAQWDELRKAFEQEVPDWRDSEKWSAPDTYALMKEIEAEPTGERVDPLFDKVLRHVREEELVSIPNVQRVFKLGYNRAAKIIEQLEQHGHVSAADHIGKRTVIQPKVKP